MFIDSQEILSSGDFIEMYCFMLCAPLRFILKLGIETIKYFDRKLGISAWSFNDIVFSIFVQINVVRR